MSAIKDGMIKKSRKILKRALILGAAGRDFHNAMMICDEYYIAAFTHGQLPINKKFFPSKYLGYRVPIYKEKHIEAVIKKHKITDVFFSYSDVPFDHVMKIASISIANNTRFHLLGKETMLKSKKKVIAVTATRTGSGKSPITELISLYLRRKGFNVGIIRHPMPYRNLNRDIEVFKKLDDLKHLTIEEAEDFERHIRNGFTVYAGIDYKKVLATAEKQHDILLWDGGNNDFPFIKSDLWICIADAMRANDEIKYYPGMVNFLNADLIIISKYNINKKARKGKEIIEMHARELNKRAKVFYMKFDVYQDKKIEIKGKNVLIIEDGPSITHGNREYGAGFVYAKKMGANIIDARKYVSNSRFYRDIYNEYKHINSVVPAIGYDKYQLKALEQFINSINADYVLIATPTDLEKRIMINKPIINIYYKATINNEKAFFHFIDEHIG
ncbi:MAG: hypothetical protein QXS91_03750 [Candidatus Anstonellales archaeon]